MMDRQNQLETLIGCSTVEKLNDENSKFVDSGASDHMSSHIEWFVDYKQFNNNLEVRIGDGTKNTAYGKGNINILVFANRKWTENHMSDVLYGPDMKVNLFSSGACLGKGIKNGFR